jgi:outer membrane immunogenic protein
MDRFRATLALLLATTAVASLVVAPTPGEAADFSRPAPLAAQPVATWTGCSAGGHVGYAWSKQQITATNVPREPTSAFEVGAEGTLDGTLFGGQVGCDVQFSPWVVGVEGSFSGAAMNGFGFATATPPGVGNQPCCFSWFKVDNFSSVTGRLGYTGWDPRLMLYVRGGGAWAHDEYMFSYSQKASQTRSGWTIGGGLAYAPTILPNWEFFVEYNHYDFGTKWVGPVQQCCNGPPFTFDSFAVSQNIDAVKTGANYRFSWGR